MPVPTAPATAASALVRATVYELLARCFAHPSAEAHTAMVGLVEEAGAVVLGSAAADLPATLARHSRADLEAGYIATFTAVTSPDCPTYESAYVCTDGSQQTSVMATVASFYHAFGVDAAQPGFRPDDLCLELSFMGFLCQKEAYAAEHMGAPRVRQARRAQRLFLQNHLGRWGKTLGEALMLRSPHDFYQALGCALRDWLAEEIRETGAEPIDRVAAPAMPWPKPERGGGFDIGGPSGLVSLEDIAVEEPR